MANGNFGGGNGGIDTPYLVEDAADLNAVRNKLGAAYLQTKDITLSGEFEPIGSDSSPFTGIYDGGEKKINNLIINVMDTTSSSIYVGMFRRVTGRLANIRVASGNVSVTKTSSGATFASVIVGYYTPSPVNSLVNCHNGANITVTFDSTSGSNLTIGAVCAYTQTTAEGCSNSGSITSTRQHPYGTIIGGVIGSVDSRLSDCFNTGNIVSNAGHVSGVLGTKTTNGPSRISRCYNTGDISTTNGNGEAYGITYGGVYGASCFDCYNTGSITSKGGLACGISRNAQNCYNSGNITGQSGRGVASTAINCYNLCNKMTRNSGSTSLDWHRVGVTNDNCYALDSLAIEFL